MWRFQLHLPTNAPQPRHFLPLDGLAYTIFENPIVLLFYTML